MARIRDYEPPEEDREGKLRLDFNENTVGCSAAVLRALRKVTPEQLAMYPEYEKSERRLAASFGVRPAEMLLTNGVDDALRLLMEVFIEPGDSVLVPEPTFSMYRFFSQVAGARIVSVRYDEAMNFPLEETLRELRRSPNILFIANPNNPTGTLLDEAALKRILDAARRTLVLVDEAYFDFAGITALPWIRRRPNLVVSRTFSKAEGLAAVRLGALFARADVIAGMRKAFTPYPVNSLALVAAEAALSDRKFLRAYIDDVLESRKQLTRGLEELGARVFPSGANFVLADFGPGGSRLVKRLAGRGILVRDRAGEFGRDGFVRITAGTVAQTRRLLKTVRLLKKGGGAVKRGAKVAPKLVIFDVDGVLVDVHGSFHRSILDTVKYFTGRRFTYNDIQQWKSRSGYNDDWRLSTDWVNSLGTKAEYAEVKRVFEKMYWGTNGTKGNVWREKWLVSPRLLERWATRAELALFTGRNRRELMHTLKHFGVGKLFSRTVTMDDVKNLKPNPEGLLRLLDGNEPESALYLGDNLDDALASERAGVPFLGVLRHGSEAHRVRASQLRRHGARAILHSTNELEKYWR